MADADNPDAIVEKLAEKKEWRAPRTIDGLLDAWENFVAECEAGYSLSIYEYENDRAVRGMIEAVLTDSVISGNPLLAEFQHRVFAADERLKRIFQKDSRITGEGLKWWEEGIPRFAGADLASDYKQIFGSFVETIRR